MTENNIEVPVVVEENSWLNRLKTLLGAKKYKRAAIFTHAYPDPDAVGSIMGMEWLLNKSIGLESSGFYGGPVSHPQNIAMVNLLDPNLRTICEYKPEEFDLKILVDTVPSNAGIGENSIVFDLVIDHHRELCPPDFAGLFINFKAGSCCGTIYEIIQQLGLNFKDDNEADIKVATGLLIGITTDTENLMSDDATKYEFKAWAGLFDYRDGPKLQSIVNYDRPKFWIDTKAKALTQYIIEDSVGVVGMGLISGKHRDMIADMAQEMMGWEGVETAIAFALVDGDRVEGSVRSKNPGVSVPKLCVALGGKYGKGGGKLGKGAYKMELAGGGIDDEDTADIKCQVWELLKEKEKKRILRIVRK